MFSLSRHIRLSSILEHMFSSVLLIPLWQTLITIARNTSPENKFLFNVIFYQVRKHLPLEGIFDSDDIMREFSVVPSSGTVTNFKHSLLF